MFVIKFVFLILKNTLIEILSVYNTSSETYYVYKN